ncbi:hypothetical protein [Streptomyces sp. NRRL F-2664]|uniref:hypothetical protein n=1 Tax=Streptomyces sp. NRRL F-2664 TaxID=1463842 RepID=UPI000AE2648D|nr:hypothetical protein [Streptomyces sp. NRRL F-2664]
MVTPFTNASPTKPLPGARAAGHPRHAGQVADFLRAAELNDVERAALDQGVTVRRGQGYTLRVSAVPAVHHRLLARCQPLDGGPGSLAVPAQRKARREYENRGSTVAPTGP